MLTIIYICYKRNVKSVSRKCEPSKTLSEPKKLMEPQKIAQNIHIPCCHVEENLFLQLVVHLHLNLTNHFTSANSQFFYSENVWPLEARTLNKIYLIICFMPWFMAQEVAICERAFQYKDMQKEQRSLSININVMLDSGERK